jgi:electron transport complex protein RnfG
VRAIPEKAHPGADLPPARRRVGAVARNLRNDRRTNRHNAMTTLDIPAAPNPEPATPIKPGSLIHGVILGVFCLGFGLILALTDLYTVDDIAARALEDRQNSLKQVMPDEIHDNNPVIDTLSMKNDSGKDITVYRARRAGKITGVAYEIYGSGYAGEIKLMMGIDSEGRVLGVRPLAHKETPGLGDKIEEKKGDWILRFTGLSLGNPAPERWKVKKDGGDFDQFAGATITPRGVVGAIRGGLDFFAAHKDELLKESQ